MVTEGDAVISHYSNDSCTSEWLREMRTIEGDVQHDAVEFVSALKPHASVALMVPAVEVEQEPA